MDLRLTSLLLLLLLLLLYYNYYYKCQDYGDIITKKVAGAPYTNKKHLKNAGPIRHCEPFYIAIRQVLLLSHAATVARHLRIYVHDNDDNDNA